MKRTKRKYIFWLAIFSGIFIGYLVLNTYLFNGIRPKQIDTNGFHANYFSSDNTDNQVTIILIGGGQWGDYWGQEFAKRGYVGLSLPYTGNRGLPTLIEEIPLEYFEQAVDWLQEQPQVNPKKIIVMGASKNAELALLLASTFPDQINGVIAYAPSSVVWSNTVLPYSSEKLKPTWTYRQNPIPYIPMEKIKAPNSKTIETLTYWKEGLNNHAKVEKYEIQVEKINGPILLFSGKDDQVWPSSFMSNMIEERLKANNFKFGFENIRYKNAGHLISSNPDVISSSQKGQMKISGKTYDFEFGGTVEGDQEAKKDARNKILKFLSTL